MRRIVYNERERFAEWARARIPHVPSWGEWYEAIGLEQDGEPMAAAVYNLYSGADIAMSYAGLGKQWASRGFLRAIFGYPFLQLGCRRISGYVAVSNQASLDFALRLGAQIEGRMREALETGEDVWVLGMLRNECRWVQ